MFILAAVICWALAFLLELLATDLGRINLVVLGLFFLGVHLLIGAGPLWRRQP